MTLAEWKAKVRARMTSRIPELINMREQSVAGILSDILAGAMFELAQSIPPIARAAHPATASGEHLDSLAQVWGIQRKSEESDEMLRARLIKQIRLPIQAGTAADWERWAIAQEDPQVTRAFISDNPPVVRISAINDNTEDRIVSADVVGADLLALADEWEVSYDDREDNESDADYYARIDTAAFRERLNINVVRLRKSERDRLKIALNHFRPAGCELLISSPIIQPVNIELIRISPDTPHNRERLRDDIKDAVQKSYAPGDQFNPAIIYQVAQTLGINVTTEAGIRNADSPNHMFGAAVQFRED